MATNEAICNCVEESMVSLSCLFERESTRFYTEADIQCHFRRLLEESLSGIGVGTVPDTDGHPHTLVHSEFPTPFRCDMGGNRFSVKADDERTPRNGLYRRGFYDVVVLAPEFVKRHSFQTLKSQDFRAFKTTVLPTLAQAGPAILHGIELAYSRDAVKSSERVREFAAKVLQDAKKLEASCCQVPGFMQHCTTLAFLKGSTSATVEEIRNSLQDTPNVRLIAVE